MVVKPGEGPPGDESVREAPSQLGDDNAFVKRVAVGFSAPGGEGGGSSGKVFIGESG
jgi:hypothetical protein